MAIGYLILGVGLLAAIMLLARWFVSANPATVARAVKWVALILIGLIFAFLLLTGRAGPALALAGAVLMLYRGLRGLPYQMAAQAPPSPGQSSEVESEYLKMELDHDSGVMNGRILKGTYAGRDLSDLELEDLLKLFDELTRCDEPSARLLESYLDRGPYPDWREEMTRRGAAASPGKIHMTREEACEILGVDANAPAEEIKAAHRRLMSVNHPDRGGSSYLAAKINLAKEILLGA